MSGHTSICVAAGAIALVVTVIAAWSRARWWLASSILMASMEIGYGLVRGRSHEGHTIDTQIAIGAGLVAFIILIVRFGLGPVTRQIGRV